MRLATSPAHSTLKSPSVVDAAKITPGSFEGDTVAKTPSPSAPGTRSQVRPELEETYNPPVRMEAANTSPVAAKS